MQKRNTLILGLALFSSMAFGAALTNDQLLEATKLAMADYTAANPTHVDHVTGFKSWKSGTDGKVRIYVTHGGHKMETDYTCMDHGSGLECLAD